MMTSINWNIFRVTGPWWGIRQSPVSSAHKGHWRAALMFSLISAWPNGWVNNRYAGDLRRHSAHYDVTVMFLEKRITWQNNAHCLQFVGRYCWWWITLSVPGQNGGHFEDDIAFFVNEKFCVLIKIAQNFVSDGPITNSPAWVRIVAWGRRQGIIWNNADSIPWDAYMRH